jgi:archaetidylinositol phosphate synthase
LIGQIADCADGDMARLTRNTSRAGAFLDSVLDRWTDAALILGLGFSDLERYGAAAALALSGSFLVSYARARALSLGVDCPDGIATRDTRMLIIMLAAVFNWVLAGLITVAVLGLATSITRSVWTMRALRHQPVNRP